MKQKHKTPAELKYEAIATKIKKPRTKVEDLDENRLRGLISACQLLNTMTRVKFDDFKEIMPDSRVTYAKNGFSMATKGLELVYNVLFGDLLEKCSKETLINFNKDFFYFEDVIEEFVSANHPEFIERKANAIAEILSTHGIEGGKQEVIIEKILSIPTIKL